MVVFRLHAPRKKKGTASGSGPLVDRHCAGGGEMKRGENEWWAREQGALSEIGHVGCLAHSGTEYYWVPE